MKQIISLVFIWSAILFAQQELRFVNYGAKSNSSEGDDNHIQVINIKIPDEFTGRPFLRLYDMSCGSPFDIAIGGWNSRFRFTIYKGEHKEIDFLKNTNYRTEISKSLISRFEIGQDSRYYDSWYNFVDLSKNKSDNSIYSLVVEGIEGDDGNDFKVFVSSDSTINKEIHGLEIYSFEPTLAFKSFSNKISFSVTPSKNVNEIIVHTFDLDGTKSYFSSILRDEEPIAESFQDQWNQSKFPLTRYEKENLCAVTFGPENHPDNDVTFYFSDQDGNRLKIKLPSFEKAPAEIPSLVKEIKIVDCLNFSLNLSSSTSRKGNPLLYRWAFEDGFNSGLPALIRSFTEAGKYNGEAVVIDTLSQVITRGRLEKFQIIINDPPVAIAGDDMVGMPNQQIQLNGGMSKDSDGLIKSYSWNFGDGNVGSGVKVTHPFATPGNYSVILTVKDDYPVESCNFDADTVLVAINSAPIADTKSKIIGSVNEELVFDASASSDKDGKIVDYSWDFGVYGKQNGISVRKSFPKAGTFPVKLLVLDNSTAGNNKGEKSVNVLINSAPKAVAGKNKIVSENEEVTFDASESLDKDGKIKQYEWNYGDGKSEAGIKTTHVFQKSGIYKVILKVTDDSETSSDTNYDSLVVTVNDRPVAVIENEIYLSDGFAKFDASKSSDNIGGIASYVWNFGDGKVGEGKTITHTYSVPGTYQVILKVQDKLNTSNNHSFDTSRVIINKRPISDPGPDHLISEKQTIKFSGSYSVDQDGKIAKYKWFIDNNLVSEEESFEYLFTLSGRYSVCLEVTDDGKFPLTGMGYSTVIVNKPPVPNINFIQNCAPMQKIKLDASQSTDLDGTIKEYNWSFSDGTKASGKVVEKTFGKPGVYTVTLSLKDNSEVENSIAYKTEITKVNNSPVIKIEDEIATCENIITFDASKSLDPDGDNLSFIWEFANAEKVRGSSIITHTFNETGFYPVTLTLDDGLGLENSISKKTINVRYHQPPVADAGKDTTVCAGDIVIFSGLKSSCAENGLLKYEWIFDDDTRMEGSNVFRVFKKGGIYSVILKVTDDSGLKCNTDIDSKIIQVLEAPIAVAGEDIVTCANKPVIFDGSKSSSPGGLVSSYQWDFGDGESGVGVNPIHLYAKSGSYKVTLTITGDVKGKCDNMAKDELIVNVTDGPSASFAVKDSIPENVETTFDASQCSTSSGSIVSYKWNFGDSTSATGMKVIHKYLKSGIYNVGLTIQTNSKSECNSASSSRIIYVNASPIARARIVDSCAVGETVLFNASGSTDFDGKISEYIWDYGDGTKGTGINSVHRYMTAGKYKVSLLVKDETWVQNNSSQIEKWINVNSSPIPKFIIPETAFLFEEITFDASSSVDPDGKIILFEWYLDNTKISDNISFQRKFDSIGLYKVRLIVTDNSNQLNKKSEVTQYLRIVKYPKLEIPRSMVVCSSESFTIQPIFKYEGLRDQIKFIWRLKGSDDSLIVRNFKVENQKPGKYLYQLEVRNESNNVIAVDSTEVIVNQSPAVPIMKDITATIGQANDEIIFDASNSLDADGNLLKIKWNFGDGKTSDQVITSYKYEKEGVYQAELEVDDQMNSNCSKVISRFKVTILKSR